MEVISSGPAGGADISYHIAFVHGLTNRHGDSAAVRVNSGKSAAVVDDDVVAESPVPAAVAVGCDDCAALGCVDVLSAYSGVADVNAVVVSAAPCVISEVGGYVLEIAVQRPSESVRTVYRRTAVFRLLLADKLLYCGVYRFNVLVGGTDLAVYLADLVLKFLVVAAQVVEVRSTLVGYLLYF